MALLDWLAETNSSPLIWQLRKPPLRELGRLIDEFRESNPPSRRPVRARLTDGNGLDEAVFVRGNPKIPGDRVARRFLEAVDGTARSAFKNGSGRAELAQRMVDPSNPLLARVGEPRWASPFWTRHCRNNGRFRRARTAAHASGIARLAGRLVSHPGDIPPRSSLGWLLRLLRMSSQPTDSVAEKRPNNLLWHRMPVRRLEGEAIRDSMLALSGRSI
jgi:hypothetical protein